MCSRSKLRLEPRWKYCGTLVSHAVSPRNAPVLDRLMCTCIERTDACQSVEIQHVTQHRDMSVSLCTVIFGIWSWSVQPSLEMPTSESADGMKLDPHSERERVRE